MDRLKILNGILIFAPCVSSMIPLQMWRNKQILDHARSTSRRMQDYDDARETEGCKIKEGEVDSVSTATLIDILQVEQLSSRLTTAS